MGETLPAEPARQFEKKTGGGSFPLYALRLAEAWAWIERPGQSHGGSSGTSG
jgi:hypothetical protein